MGKLVILFDGNRPTGEQVELDGRTFWVRGDSGYTTILTRTLPGEPEGTVLIQFPDDTGWTGRRCSSSSPACMSAPGAQQGVG